jgi:hypothetical protein
VILISADGKKPEQQTVDDTEILQIVAESGVQTLLVVQPLPDEGTQDKNAKPEDAHERHAERDDREQRGNVIDPGEHRPAESTKGE